MGIFRFVAASLFAACAALPAAGSAGAEGLFSGTWHLTVGATAFRAPRFEGSRDYMLAVQPLVSLGKAGTQARFSSRNDNISLGFIDTGNFRAGAVGKIIWGRDANDAQALAGLSPVRFGGEVGGFAEVYPTDWLRVRGEVRHGIRSHTGVVADLSADAFVDLTSNVRLSGGPRMSVASADYFEAYFGVTPAESAASGLAPYSPGGGLKSLGVGGAIDWKVTEKLTTSVFGEYSVLAGPAADSSLVRQKGDADQLLIGISTTYRFDFDL